MHAHTHVLASMHVHTIIIINQIFFPMPDLEKVGMIEVISCFYSSASGFDDDFGNYTYFLR